MLPGPLLTSASFKHHEIAETLHKIEREVWICIWNVAWFSKRPADRRSIASKPVGHCSSWLWCFAPEPPLINPRPVLNQLSVDLLAGSKTKHSISRSASHAKDCLEVASSRPQVQVRHSETVFYRLKWAQISMSTHSHTPGCIAHTSPPQLPFPASGVQCLWLKTVTGSVRVLDSHFALKNIKQSFVKPMLIGSYGAFTGGETGFLLCTGDEGESIYGFGYASLWIHVPKTEPHILSVHVADLFVPSPARLPRGITNEKNEDTMIVTKDMLVLIDSQRPMWTTECSDNK